MKCPHCGGSGEFVDTPGAMLRRLREARGLTLREVADLVPGVSYANLAKIEAGQAPRAAFEAIAALAAFYGVSLDDLRPREVA